MVAVSPRIALRESSTIISKMLSNATALSLTRWTSSSITMLALPYQVVIIDGALVRADGDLSDILALTVVDADVIIRNAITPQTPNVLLYQHYPWN